MKMLGMQKMQFETSMAKNFVVEQLQFSTLTVVVVVEEEEEEEEKAASRVANLDTINETALTCLGIRGATIDEGAPHHVEVDTLAHALARLLIEDVRHHVDTAAAHLGETLVIMIDAITTDVIEEERESVMIVTEMTGERENVPLVGQGLETEEETEIEVVGSGTHTEMTRLPLHLIHDRHAEGRVLHRALLLVETRDSIADCRSRADDVTYSSHTK